MARWPDREGSATMGAIKQQLIEVMELGYLDWAEVPRDLLIELGLDGMTPASGPICGDYGNREEQHPDGDTPGPSA